MPSLCCTCVCVCVGGGGVKSRMKCYSVFAYVINRVSLCSWFCIYFVDPTVFVLCAWGSR